MKKISILVIFLSAIVLVLCTRKSDVKTITTSELRDKIMGGWAGKMIGVSYGAPTEFKAKSAIYEAPLNWSVDQVRGSLRQDDLYVQMSFMMTMDKYGPDAPAEKFAESFASAGYQLWCANVQARKNFFDGIMPPLSGSPAYSLWADAIDFQIEADYIGFMNPGMPQSSNAICDKIGHIMNYGDGVYGGMFVCALYTQAFFNKDLEQIVQTAVQAIPAKSQYAQCIQDVIRLHNTYPEDWRTAWDEFEGKWGSTDLSDPYGAFNIDAKVNGAYIVFGLLYGGGDFQKTMEITIRCGQDSDCNPSNAAAVLGVRDGYGKIPDVWKSSIPSIADSVFIFTDYSFNKVVANTLKYARQQVLANGGRIEGETWHIASQKPKPPRTLEVSFPGVTPAYAIDVTDENAWTWDKKWQTEKGDDNQTIKSTTQKDAETSVVFTGTGIAFRGDWFCNGGRANVFVDDKLDRTIDTFYCLNNEGHHGQFLYHVIGLSKGKHTVKIVTTGEKNEKSSGTEFCIRGAVVFTSSK
jgi:hypothetical protein